MLKKQTFGKNVVFFGFQKNTYVSFWNRNSISKKKLLFCFFLKSFVVLCVFLYLRIPHQAMNTNHNRLFN